MGPLLFWVQGSRQLPTLPALAGLQPPSPSLPWAHRQLRGCCSGTVEDAQAPHSVVELHKKGLGPTSMGVTGDAWGPGSAPCSSSITCKFWLG